MYDADITYAVHELATQGFPDYGLTPWPDPDDATIGGMRNNKAYFKDIVINMFIQTNPIISDDPGVPLNYIPIAGYRVLIIKSRDSNVTYGSGVNTFS